MTVIEDIRQRLQALSPQKLEIIDDSHLHAGHAGNQQGGGHFRLLIVSTAFQQATRLDRQRLIKNLLHDLFAQRIHALSIQALTPDEFNHKSAQ
ncbi:BolA family transcriptional regulator [Snodgrassella sp. CFCC 13594]|jgi:BolA protein|uniref:BolA family protein n=1 Tax=Snodgrassella sp. CFCC 13594 TaxID=1775559 RepID=UPI00082F0FD1|nr:BolA family protein [Snodgrassella sp. CFCC 13594]